MLRFIGSLEHSAEAQAAFAVGYSELFSLVTWTSFGLMAAAAAVAGQNLGAGRPERSIRGVHVAAGIGVGVAAVLGLLFITVPGRLFALFGINDPVVVGIGAQRSRFSVCRGSLSRSRSPTGGSGRATHAHRCTSRSSRRSACPSASASFFGRCARCNLQISGWRFCWAMRAAVEVCGGLGGGGAG
jgi:hypothetical protein